MLAVSQMGLCGSLRVFFAEIPTEMSLNWFLWKHLQAWHMFLRLYLITNALVADLPSCPSKCLICQSLSIYWKCASKLFSIKSVECERSERVKKYFKVSRGRKLDLICCRSKILYHFESLFGSSII